jgi:hypothetical protein
MTDEAMSPLRRRMIEDMAIRKLAPKTQQGYIRIVKEFAASRGLLAWRFADAGPGVRGTVIVGRHPKTFTLPVIRSLLTFCQPFLWTFCLA